MWFALGGVLAAAQSPETHHLDVQLFRPSIDGTATLWVDDAARMGHGTLTGRAVLGYVRAPLTVTYPDENGAAKKQISVLPDLAQVDLIGGATLGPVRLGVHAPVHGLVRCAEGACGHAVSAGIGDMALDAKWVALDPDVAPVGLGVSGRLTVPTNTVAAPTGSSAVTWETAAILHGEAGPVLLALNAGYRGVPEGGLVGQDPIWDDQVVVRAASALRLDQHAISVEVASHLPVTVPSAPPVEALLGGSVGLRDDVDLRLAAGMGLTEGVGSPAARILAAVVYAPPNRDRDADGVTDKDDLCPREPEDRDGNDDQDGCADEDNDRDGLADAADACPDAAEDFDGYRDEDGCADPHTAVVRVVDAFGSLVTGVRVRVEAAEDPVVSEKPVFELHLAPGTYPIVAEASGFLPLEDVVVVPDGPATEVIKVLQTAHDTGTLSLRVMNEDGAELPSEWSLDGGASASAPTEGVSTAVPVGAHQVLVRSVGYAPLSFPVHIDPGQTTTVPVTLKPPRVKVLREKIEIYGKIFFESAASTIDPESHELLDEIAQTLVDYPQLVRIRIEGHTDSRGNRLVNLELSQHRADAVQAYLVGRGVDARRLVAVGYGSMRPLQEGDDEEAHGFNRRVEFWVEERRDPEDG